MIRLWDFADCECGVRHNDTPVSAKQVPQTIKCDCGKRVGWVMGKRNHIHSTHSGRKYGEFDPQFGCVVEDYSHKKRLLKQMGAEETAPWTKDESQAEKERIESRATERDPNVITADSEDEILSQINQGMVDRKATGKPRVWAEEDDEGWMGGL